MTADILLEGIGIAGLFFYAMLLSGADAAFSTLSKSTVQQLKDAQSEGASSRITMWIDRPERLFGTIIIGKTILTVGLMIWITDVIMRAASGAGLGLFATLISAAVLLVMLLAFGVEWVPRVWANRKPDVANIDLFAEVAGSVVAAALVVAVESWGRNGCSGDLGELVAASLDLVRCGLASLA